jgi:MSHA pilin protein MshC
MAKPISHPRCAGFTLIELIAVIIVLGILAVTIMPRLQTRAAYDERLFTDELISTARYAQQQAMMRGNNFVVRLTIDNAGGTYGIEVDDGTGFQWINHANGRAFPHSFPGGMAVAPALVSQTYNALGQVTANVAQAVTINGTRMFCIQATGYTHDGAC